MPTCPRGCRASGCSAVAPRPSRPVGVHGLEDRVPSGSGARHRRDVRKAGRGPDADRRDCHEDRALLLTSSALASRSRSSCTPNVSRRAARSRGGARRRRRAHRRARHNPRVREERADLRRSARPSARPGVRTASMTLGRSCQCDDWRLPTGPPRCGSRQSGGSSPARCASCSLRSPSCSAWASSAPPTCSPTP